MFYQEQPQAPIFSISGAQESISQEKNILINIFFLIIQNEKCQKAKSSAVLN